MNTEYEPIITKVERDDDGISVYVEDANGNPDYPSAWIDCYKRDGDICTDWNKYIFYLWKEADVKLEEFQRTDNGIQALECAYDYAVANL